MIECQFDTTFTIEADEGGESRILAGMAVPWNVVRRTTMGPTKFLAGAIEAGDRPVVLRDHDRTRPIGVVVAGRSEDDGLHAKVRVSNTVLGTETLALAADGALRGFSVGVQPTQYHHEDDPIHGRVVVVQAGQWKELSVLPFPAYEQATITEVAATQQEEPVADTTPTTTEPVVQATEPVVVPTTTHPIQVREPKRLTAGALAHVMVLAQRGDERAMAFVTDLRAAEADPEAAIVAALTGNVTVPENIGIVPPSYSSDLIGNLPVATPFLDSCVRRTTLPSTGMSIVKPKWTTVPEGDWVTTENAQPPTNAVMIGSYNVDVLTYAHAIQASLNLINRSDFGGYANAYFQSAGIDYLAKKEAKASGVAFTAAPATALTGITTAQDAILRLVTAVIAQQTDASGAGDGFRGLLPTYAAVAPNVWEDLASTAVLAGVAYSEGSVGFVPTSGTIGGLRVVMVPSLAANYVLVGSPAATVVHDGSEMQLRALVVNTLSMELGVIGNAAFDVEYPLALAKGTYTPSGTGALSAPAAKK